MIELIAADHPEQYAVARTLFREYAAQLGHDLCFQRFDEELASLPGAYAPPGGCLLLARDHDQWVGCVALRAISDTVCEMKRLYVRPSCRGRGLGRQLAEAVVQRAKTIGYQRMRLDTLESMTEARTLYQSLGFRETESYYYNPIGGVVFYALDLTRPAAPQAR